MIMNSTITNDSDQETNDWIYNDKWKDVYIVWYWLSTNNYIDMKTKYETFDDNKL